MIQPSAHVRAANRLISTCVFSSESRVSNIFNGCLKFPSVAPPVGVKLSHFGSVKATAALLAQLAAAGRYGGWIPTTSCQRMLIAQECEE